MKQKIRMIIQEHEIHITDNTIKSQILLDFFKKKKFVINKTSFQEYPGWIKEFEKTQRFIFKDSVNDCDDIKIFPVFAEYHIQYHEYKNNIFPNAYKNSP